MVTRRSALLKVLFFAAFIFSSAFSGFAQEFNIVDSVKLKSMIGSGEKFLLIDARTKEEFEEAHIVKAVSVPEKKFEELSSSLPADKSTHLVIYCNGVKCGKSKKVAAKAAAAGYTNISLYNEGFPVWEELAYPITAGTEYGKKIETAKLKPAELRKLIESGSQEVVIVDVRDEQEFREGHIPGAINIPVETFALKSGVLPKEKQIVVYCNTGGRSYTAYRKLIQLAYPNIYQSMFADWKESGLFIEN
jgi:rhodanese-related sulfurtransferase